MLVIGSGASGLAAAVAAERAGGRVALATKGSLQANNSSKAQGGIQAAFGADDSPEQHAEDVWRSSHETSDPRLVEVLTGERPVGDPLARRAGVEFTRENGGYRLARCGGASAKRLLQVGDRRATRSRRACATPGRPERERATPIAAPRALRGRRPLARARRRTRSSRQARSCWPPADGVTRRPSGARALHEPPERDGRGDAARARARRGGPRPRCLAVPPERGRLAAEHAGLLDPETTRAYGAVLLNADGEEFTDSLGPRDEVSQAIFDEVAKGKGTSTRGPSESVNSSPSAFGAVGAVDLRI